MVQAFLRSVLRKHLKMDKGQPTMNAQVNGPAHEVSQQI